MEAAILLWLFCATMGAGIAKSKNRHWTEGLLLGGLLGVLGVIIELFLRAQSPSLPAAGWYPDPESAAGQKYWNGREWSDLPPRPATRRAPQPVAEPAAALVRTKKCPDCAETILTEARVCKHCGFRFPGDTTQAAHSGQPHGKLIKVRCHHCQHVQAVSVNDATFACEECGTQLKRRTTPAKKLAQE
ncbi:zinc ribbon domain-containing protein [Mycobacterium marinum]|uniref:zinc ribbon domain-containing protein n=1 Tax=Mycobacterium marinum TaxID=1781 RepID=UPI00116044ED|nr:zinc ribbon domain-containing protein [Mycobacterium marinum]